jgi:hypothetical protein
LDGYFVALCAAQQADGWWSWVQFEQDLEFRDGFTRTPAFRHRVPGVFATKAGSLDAALEYAFQLVERGQSRPGCTDRQEVRARISRDSSRTSEPIGIRRSSIEADTIGEMSNSNRPYLSFFVIEHAGHGSAALEEQRHGGQHCRFLNVTGRWSARGTRAVPLLAWTDRQEVEAASAIASKARDRVFKVSSLGGDSLVAEHFAAFSEHHAEALLGYLPYATAAARKLEELRVKTIDCAGAVLRVHRAADTERAQVLKDEDRGAR